MHRLDEQGDAPRREGIPVKREPFRCPFKGKRARAAVGGGAQYDFISLDQAITQGIAPGRPEMDGPVVVPAGIVAALIPDDPIVTEGACPEVLREEIARAVVIVGDILFQNGITHSAVEPEATAVGRARGAVGEGFVTPNNHPPTVTGPDAGRPADVGGVARSVTEGAATLDQRSVHLGKQDAVAGMLRAPRNPRV